MSILPSFNRQAIRDVDLFFRNPCKANPDGSGLASGLKQAGWKGHREVAWDPVPVIVNSNSQQAEGFQAPY